MQAHENSKGKKRRTRKEEEGERKKEDAAEIDANFAKFLDKPKVLEVLVLRSNHTTKLIMSLLKKSQRAVCSDWT